MDWLFDVEWAKVLVPGTPVLEVVLRGTLMYLALFALMRIVLRRQAGGLGITDVLVVVLVADAAQNGMADDYSSIPDGVLLVAVILGWAWFLDWAGFRFPWLERIIKPGALLLVKDGRMLRHNMAKEFVTADELQGHLRERGIDDLARVKQAFLEPNGTVSVITADASSTDTSPGRLPV